MDHGETESLRAFVTCSARSFPAVAPLLAEVENLLQGAGWRTRVPRRRDGRHRTGIEDRRRLRLESYREIERAAVVLHVPAPGGLGGTRLHREVGHAVRAGVPLLIVTASDFRLRFGMGLPSPERLAWLLEVTGARVIDRLADLVSIVADTARQR